MKQQNSRLLFINAPALSVLYVFSGIPSAKCRVDSSILFIKKPQKKCLKSFYTFEAKYLTKKIIYFNANPTSILCIEPTLPIELKA